MQELIVKILGNIQGDFTIVKSWSFTRPEKFILIWGFLTCIYIYALLLQEEKRNKK